MWLLGLKAAASGAWKILRSMPWWTYLAAAVLLITWRWHAGVVRDARAEADQDARRSLAPVLMQAHADAATRLQQAADAEGRAAAFEHGLNQCIGERTKLATITSAVLAERKRAEADAQRKLNAARQELHHAYSIAADNCAAQPVPAGVLGVLDDAASRASGSDANADGERAGPAVRPSAGRAHDTDTCTASQWLDLPRHDGLDHGLGRCIAAVQCGQGRHRGDQDS